MLTTRTLLLSLLAVGCASPEPGRDGRDGSDGINTLVVAEDEPPGENCALGGVVLHIGPDKNADGTLQAGEIAQRTYVCNQRVDGDSSLVAMSAIGAGAECASGGTRIDAGVDRDRDGILDPNEIDTTAYICDGNDGEDGANGTNGTDGLDGSDGHNALVRVEQIPAEVAGECYFGGIRVLSGTDTNDDGILQPAEVVSEEAVCRIQTNEHRTLVESSVELPAGSCSNGGVRMDVGYDDDGDGVLAVSEIDDTTYLCSEVQLLDGASSLVELEAAGGNLCPWGGTVVTSGLDQDRSGSLTADEIDQTAVLCSGADGYNSVVGMYDDGGYCGPEGGYLVQSGLDLDDSGTLEVSEVTSEGYICNGVDGFLGYDGFSSLIRMGDDNGYCGAYGGLSIEVGLDVNENNYLDAAEVEQTEYVCNGYDGLNTLIALTYLPYDAGCDSSGVLVESGLDLNDDGFLDGAEVEYSEVVCDGVP